MIPAPRKITWLSGEFRISNPLCVSIACDLPERALRIIQRWMEAFPKPIRLAASDDAPRYRSIKLFLARDAIGSEFYQLQIRQNEITMTGFGMHGLFHGLQTLRRIAITEGDGWRCRFIDDGPAMGIRGLSLDVSRGKIPTNESLRWLVDRMADLKMNHLQLYVEHTFAFEFDAEISRDCSPLTPDDIRSLDAYCRDRFIDLVPSLATFGHMGRILSLPQYRSLAEVESTRDWTSQSWLQRQRGLTLDPLNPAGRQLVTRMLDEFLPCFSSGQANVNADETHDLGCGKNREHADRVGRGRMYVDHLKFLAEALRRHGKRMMCWGDILRGHQDLIGELPMDAMLLDWGYEADSQFDVTKSPARHDRPVCVCPATRGWGRLINDYETSAGNIDRAVATGLENNASGLIVTEWGDYGHFNMLNCSWPAIARAAERGWNGLATNDADIDAHTEAWLFADVTGRLAMLRELGQIGRSWLTWCELAQPITGTAVINRERPADGTMPQCSLTESMPAGSPPADWLARLSGIENIADKLAVDFAGSDAGWDEWELACRATALLARKHRLLNKSDGSTYSAFVDDLAHFRNRYAEAWHRHNRPHRHGDIDWVLSCMVVSGDAH